MLKKKIVFLTLVLMLIINLVSFSIPKPKNDNVGAVVGRFYLELDKDWKTLKAGKYYRGKMYIVNKDTGKEYTVLANTDGFFCILNLEPGNYVLLRFTYSITAGDTTFNMGNYFGKTGISFPISSKKITAPKTAIMLHEILPRDESQHNIDPYHSIQPMKRSLIREDNFDQLKEYFSKLDKRNQWSNFEWDPEESKKE